MMKCIVVTRNPSPERIEQVQKQEVAFRIKKCLGGRKGWKIIPTDEDDYGVFEVFLFVLILILLLIIKLIINIMMTRL